MNAHNGIIYFSITCVILALTGCDLINPPKKEEKKPAQAAKPVVDENEPLAADVVARVGNWTLTQEEFNERLKLLKEGLPEFDPEKADNKAAVLNELIRQQLLVKDAEEAGVGQQKEVKDAVEDFRRTLLVQELANRLTKDIVATEKEAQKYYEDNKADFVEATEWTAREIVVADEATAKNILVQVLQGGDFGEIAKSQSKGKTAAEGGLLKPFTRAPFEAMQTAIASLDAGGTSAVFKGPEGFYIVKVDGKKGGALRSFATVKSDLIAGLTLRKQQQAILEHIDQLASKYKVKINKELVGAPAEEAAQ